MSFMRWRSQRGSAVLPVVVSRASRGGFVGAEGWASALADTRVVVVLGARQVDKGTLLEQVASAEGADRKVLTRDDQAVRGVLIGIW
jgi:hypothetical protein